MIGINSLTSKLNLISVATSSTSSVFVMQCLSHADESLKKGSEYTIDSIDDLPNASDNKGRWIFINQKKIYTYSNGISWNIDPDNRYTEKLYTWGANNKGQLGTDYFLPISRSSPTEVMGNIYNWLDVSSTFDHTVGLTANGLLWGWGANDNNQLTVLANTGTGALDVVPKMISFFNDYIQVATGELHTIALRSNGIVNAWGANASGQLGDNTTIIRNTPVAVTGTNIYKSISAGFRHNIAIANGDGAWCWGRNTEGQLGDNSTLARSSPVMILNTENFIDVAAGAYHNAGLTSNGTIYTWGKALKGQLGDNSTTNRSSPGLIVGSITDWIKVSAGGNNSAAIRGNGSLYSWGDNSSGQIGDSTTFDRSSPRSIAGITNWIQIGVGGAHTIALTTQATLYTWGNNRDGQLGDNTTINKSSPSAAVVGNQIWTDVRAGRLQTLGW